MPSNSKNGKPRIAVVSDRSDQPLQDLVLGLRDTGAFVDVLKDVYTAMRGLAGGAMLDRVLVDVRSLDQDELRFLRLAPRYFSDVAFSVPLLAGTEDRLGTRMDRFRCVHVDALMAEVAEAESPVDEALVEEVANDIVATEGVDTEARHDGDVSLEDRVAVAPADSEIQGDGEPATQIDRLVASSDPMAQAADETVAEGDAYVAEPLTEAEAFEAQTVEDASVAAKDGTEVGEQVPEAAIEVRADESIEVSDEPVAEPLETGEPLFEPPPSEPWEWRPAEDAGALQAETELQDAWPESEAEVAEPILPPDAEGAYVEPVEAVEDSEVPLAEAETGALADESWDDTVAAAYEEAADAQMGDVPVEEEPEAVELDAADEVTFDADQPPTGECGEDQAADSSWAEPLENMPAEPLYETPQDAAGASDRQPLSTDGGVDAAEEGPSLHEAVRRRMAGDDPRFVLRRRPPGGRVPPPKDPPNVELPAEDVETPDFSRDGGIADAGASPSDETTVSRMPGISSEDASALSSEEMDALLRDELANGETPVDSDATDGRDGGVA